MTFSELKTNICRQIEKINHVKMTLSTQFSERHERNCKKSQCPEMILNKPVKTFNKNETGLKNFLWRFQICFFQNLSRIGIEFTSLATVPNQPNLDLISCTVYHVSAKSAQFRPYWLYCLSCGFHVVRPMLSPNPEIPCPRPRSLGKVWVRGQLLGKIWGHFGLGTALKFRGEHSPFPKNPQKFETRTRLLVLGKIGESPFLPEIKKYKYL